MPKFYSSGEILKVLQKYNFYFVSQKGSHIKYRKDGDPTLTVIIPRTENKYLQELFNLL